VDGQEGGIVVELVAQELEDVQPVVPRPKALEALSDLLLNRLVALLDPELVELPEIIDLLYQLLPRLDPVPQTLGLGQSLFGVLPIVPEVGRRGLCFELLNLVCYRLDVKDASTYRRFGSSTPPRELQVPEAYGPP
jgi:hypothetical protein